MESAFVSETLHPMPAAFLSPGRYGWRDGAAGVRLRILSARALIQVMARGSNDDAIRAAVSLKYQVVLPETPVLARGPRLSFLWAGHRTWMAIADEADFPDLESVLRNDLGLLASTCDQSDGRVIVELSGPHARDTLAKLVMVDLHPRAFRPDDTAMTLLGHISGQITQIDAGPIFEVMIPRGFAETFLHDLTEAGAEFGVEFVG
jgi:sarcosine oxidase subunit gamma